MGERGRLKDLNPDVVTTYLQDNPEFLNQFVAKHVPQERVEGWYRRTSSATRDSQRISRLHNAVNGDCSPTENIKQWKMSVRGDRRRLLEKLTKSVYDLQSKSRLLSELAACTAAAIDADGYHLYLVKPKEQIIRLHTTSAHSSRNDIEWRIGPGTTLAAFVAMTKEAMCINLFPEDSRFPEGLGAAHQGSVSAVICQPVVNSNGDLLGVIELYRFSGAAPFTEEEQEVIRNIMMLGDLTIKSNEMYHNMMRQRKLNDFLLTVTKSIFQDIVSMDTVIMKIMNYAKKLVNADRTSLFLVDNRTKELYARVFDMGEEGDAAAQSAITKEIRFPMDKGVAGHVASTGEILNIQDAYADPRFNRDVDLQTGYKTDTILCMPIYIRGSIMGVVQMVNKLDGLFSKSDEESFETFAVYCGLALHHAKLYEKIRRSEQKYKVALEMLSYHAQAPEDEVARIKEMPKNEFNANFTSYEFSPWHLDVDEKLLSVINMFKDLFRNSRFSENNMTKHKFEEDSLVRFTLTVRKNYRQVPYHNWQHAFSVAHAMFTVLKTNTTKFSALEALGMFVSCLCHDLDHRGKTNSYMVKSSTPLAVLYSTSTMEHHHFNQTVAILQNDGHNIFRYLSSDEYKQVLSDIRHCILSTDLALFFGNRARLKELNDQNEFDWDNREHRHLLMANSMTACDLCSMYKPWNLQLELVHVIMEEFWLQGDKEKEAGLTPIAMMDRDKQHELPHLEVGFLVGICLPCYELLAEVLPATVPMVEGAKENLRRWQELVDKQDKEEKEANKET